MLHELTVRRAAVALAALSLGAAMMTSAPAMAQIPRQDPKSCKGQAELKPLAAARALA